MKVSIEFNESELERARLAFGNDPLNLESNPLAHVLFYEELAHFLHKVVHSTLPQLADQAFAGVVSKGTLPSRVEAEIELEVKTEDDEHDHDQNQSDQSE